MTIDFDDAILQLNLTEDELSADDIDELQLYIDAANEWVASKVTDTTPAPVRLATLMLLDHLWEVQRRHTWEVQRGPATSPLTGDDDFVSVSGFGYAIPNRVKELLEPYTGGAPSPTGSFPDAAYWPDPAERC